jgi:hypothetical protein
MYRFLMNHRPELMKRIITPENLKKCYSMETISKLMNINVDLAETMSKEDSKQS